MNIEDLVIAAVQKPWKYLCGGCGRPNAQWESSSHCTACASRRHEEMAARYIALSGGAATVARQRAFVAARQRERT